MTQSNKIKYDAGNPLANKEKEFVSRFWISSKIEEEYIKSYFFNQPETPQIKKIIGEDWDFYVNYKKENIKRLNMIVALVDSKASSKNRLLDLGCSCGQVGYFLEKKGFKVTGMDINEKSLRIGENILNQLNSKVTLKKGNGLSIPAENNSFEVVVACDVIEHISNQELFLSEIWRVLKKDGIFFLNTDNNARVQLGVFLRRIQCLCKFQNPLKWKHAWAESDGGHCALTTPKSLTKVVDKIGFKKIEYEYWGAKIQLLKPLTSPNFLFYANK